MFSEETSCSQSSKKNAKKANTFVKKKITPKFSFKKSFQDIH